MKGLGSYLKKYILDKLQSENRKKIVKNLGWLFFDKIFRMGVGMLVGVWVARYLGPAQLGILSYAQAIVAIGASIAGLGLASIAVREIVRSDEDKDTILGTSLGLMLIGALFSIVAIMVIVSYLETDNNTKIIVMIIALGTIFQSFDALDFLFQAKVQARYTVVAKNIAFFVANIIKIICLWYKMPLIVFAALGTIELVLGGINMVVAYKWAGYSLKSLKFSLMKAKELLKDSYPLIFASALGLISMRIDQIMLKMFASNEAVGIYVAGIRIVEPFYFVPVVFAQTFLPSIVNSYNNGEDCFYAMLKKISNIMVIVAYAITFPIVIFADKIILFLYGIQYQGAVFISQIMMLALVFTNLGMVVGSFLATKKLTKINFQSALIGCVLNIVLNFYLIPKYQAIGAAIASFISYGATTFFVCIIHKSLYRMGKILVLSMIYPDLFKKEKDKE